MRALVVHEILPAAAAGHTGAEVVDGTRRITYPDLYERAVRLANALQQLGVTRGAVLGIMDVNTLHNLEMHYASSMLGAVILTLNFRLSADDLLYTVRHGRADWLFVSESFQPIAAPLRQEFAKRWVWLADNREGPEPGVPTLEALVLAGSVRVPDEAARVQETDPFSLFYTTGTTGRPKGVLYRHRDMVLASLGILHHLAVHPGGAAASRHDVFFPAIPFFHIHGWGTALSVPYLGAKLVLPRRADPAEQLRLIREEGVTWTNMVPTQIHMLLNQADAAGLQDLAPLKILTGGSPLPTGLARRLRDKGVRYSLIYGGSDQLATSISVLPPDVDPTSDPAWDALARATKPLGMVEVRLVDDEGRTVPHDGTSIGRLDVRSPWLPAGYHRDAARSAASFVEGWFHTGDLAVGNPDGTHYVVDREGDALKSGGEWIATGVIEALLSEHPLVAAVAVIARPDERWGSRPLAVIQARAEVSESVLHEHLMAFVRRGQLARFWVPDAFAFVEALPVTSAGKIDKAALRRAWA